MNASGARDKERYTRGRTTSVVGVTQLSEGEAREGEREGGRGVCVFLFYVPLIINKENEV